MSMLMQRVAAFAATALFVLTTAVTSAAQDTPALPGSQLDPPLVGDPRLEKIDPRLLDDLAALEARSFIRESETRLATSLRIVIDVRRADQDPTFDNVVARDRVGAVADGVARRLAAFTANATAELAPDLRRRFRILFPLTLQYGLAAEVDDRATLLALAARNDVKYVWKDALNKLLTNQGRQITGSAAAAAAGHTGSGVGVAVIDSHFDLLHPELGGSTSLPNGIVFGGLNYSDPGTPIHSRNFNDCYHGTGTASIVRRYAPGVSLYCLTVFPNAYDSVIANAINWCVTNGNGANGGSPIRLISMSLGGGRYYSAVTSGTMHNACATAVANGIVCLAASGNDGWTNSMGSPAASTQAVSIGSVWDQNGAGYAPFPPAYCSDGNRLVNERCCYSDTASFLDLYAPSEEVICARCGGGTFALGGTSSATPAAAGLAAQLFDAAPQYVGNQSGLVSLFQSNGVAVIGDSSKRRIDLTAAINAAGGGGGGGGATALDNGVTENFSVATGSTLAYTIDVPANASNLVVTMTGGSGDADLYVKRAAINWPGDQGRHDENEFKSQYIGGSNESVTFSSPAQDTWNVLIHGYSGGPSGTVRATWDVSSGGGGGSASWNSVSWPRDTPHNYSNNRVYSHTYSYPGAQRVAIHFNRLDTETNYDFVRIKDGSGNTVFTVSGNLISGGNGTAFGRSDGWAIVDGSSITVELTTDYSVRDWGYRTDWAAAYY